MSRPSISLTSTVRGIICTVTVILFYSLGGCQRSLPIDGLVAEAQQYRQRGETRAAIIQLKNAIQKDPENGQARALLGQIYLDIGNPVSAEKEFRKALSLGVGPSEILPLLGKTMLMLGQAEQLLAEIQYGEGRNSQPEIGALRANALLAIGKIDESRELFNQILKAHHDFIGALLGLAKIEISLNKLDQASELITQALTKNPDDIDSLRLHGDLMRIREKRDEARLAYNKILKQHPDNVQAHIDIANLDIELGKFDDARGEISAARHISPASLQIMQAQALLDFREGKFKAALDSLQKLVLAAPNHMPSILLMGAVQMALDSPQQAEQYLLKFTQSNPKHIYANKMLAMVKIRLGHPELAIEIVKQLLKTTPDDIELLALAGEVELSAKHFRKAEEYLRKASKLSPKTPLVHTALAISLLGMDQKSAAIAELEQANILDSSNTKAGVMLILTYLREKETDKAIAQINLMEKQHGNKPFIHNLKGAALLAKGNSVGARVSFEKSLNLESSYLPALQNLARLDMMEKKFSQARKRLENVLNKDPKNIYLMAELAKVAISDNKPLEAVKWLESAYKEKPEEIATAIFLGDTYLKIGEKKKALLLAQKIHAADSSNINALALLAQAQNDIGELTSALDSYTKLAILLPRSAPVQLRIGGLHILLKDQVEALHAFKKALSLQPDFVAAKTATASILTIMGKYSEALVIAKAMQIEHSAFPDGYKLEGDILMAQNKPLPALKLYEIAFTKSKANSFVINIHQALTQAEKLDEARLRINNWLQQHPNDLLTRFYLAGSYMSNKKYKSAIEQYELIIKLNPNNIIAINDLAVAYQHEKDRRAMAMAQRAYELQTNNPTVIDTLGWIMLEDGDTGKAITLLKKAIELAPDSAETHYHLGVALLKSGDKKSAKIQLENLLKSKQDFPSRAEVSALLEKI